MSGGEMDLISRARTADDLPAELRERNEAFRREALERSAQHRRDEAKQAAARLPALIRVAQQLETADVEGLNALLAQVRRLPQWTDPDLWRIHFRGSLRPPAEITALGALAAEPATDRGGEAWHADSRVSLLADALPAVRTDAARFLRALASALEAEKRGEALRAGALARGAWLRLLHDANYLAPHARIVRVVEPDARRPPGDRLKLLGQLDQRVEERDSPPGCDGSERGVPLHALDGRQVAPGGARRLGSRERSCRSPERAPGGYHPEATSVRSLHAVMPTLITNSKLSQILSHARALNWGMSKKRRLLAALGVFAAAAALLAASFDAEAKKAPKYAVLTKPAQNAAPQQNSLEKPKLKAKKFLPVAEMGGY